MKYVCYIFCLGKKEKGFIYSCGGKFGLDLKTIGIAILLAIFLFPGLSSAQSGQQKPSEIFLSFNYKGLVNNVFTVYFTQKDIYIPIGQVFDLLKINNKIDKQNNTISGFFLNTKTKYVINFSSLEAHVGNQKYTIKKSDFIPSQLDYYVKISVLKKMFGLNFTPDMRDLSLTLVSNNVLPIEASLQRENKDRSISNVYEGKTYYPLIFKRKRYLTKTGMLDYNINTSYNGSTYGNSIDLTSGIKFLEGNLISDVGSSYLSNQFSVNLNSIEWQYVAQDGDPVTQVSLGDLYSNGLNSEGFEGISITNEPIHERLHYGRYVVDGNTKPDYDVELFLNGQLVAHTKTGHDGHYHLVIPLDYGTSSIIIKFYGPDGDFSEERKRIQIPYTFLPKGDFSYTVNFGGLIPNSQTFYEKPKNFLISPNVSWGVTSWLTDKIGMDYGLNPIFYNTSSFRISTPYLAALTISPHNLYQATFNALYPSQASFQLQASHYGKDYYYNNYGFSYDESKGSVYLPFHFFSHPFNLRLQGDAQQIGKKYNYGYGAGLNANWNRITLSSSYNVSSNGTKSINTNAYLSLVNARRLPFFLNGSLISGSLNYDGILKRFTNAGVEYSRTVLKYARLQLSWFRDLIQNQNTFQFRLIFNLPSMIATTSMQDASGQYVVSQNFRGGMGYDSHNHDMMYNNRRLTGSASAAVKMFVDYNGNGIQDKGEPIIKNGAVNFDQAVSQKKGKRGLIHITNLQPYYRYNITVDATGVKNPLWIPSKTQFSFIANPNIVTPIDIPFYVSGVVDGSVKKDGSGVPGMKVHFIQLHGKYHKTITTFSDGSFYYIGLPPGQYKVYPDSAQMGILKSVSAPSTRMITLKPTKNGQTIDHIDFILGAKKVITKDTTTYAVQAGSYHNIDLALHTLLNLNKKEETPFYIRFVPSDSLFRITTDCFKERIEADSLLEIVKKLYPTSIERKCGTLKPKMKFDVQLGAFKEKRRAKIYYRQWQSKTSLPIHIMNDTTVSWFKLRLPVTDTWPEAVKERNILWKVGLKDAFISLYPEQLWLNDHFYYRIQFGAYDTKSAAKYYQRRLKRKLGYSTSVTFDNKIGIYRLLLRKAFYWQIAQQVKTRMEKDHEFKEITIIQLPVKKKQ